MAVLHTLRYAAHETGFLNLHLPDTRFAFPVIVLFHGGGLENGSRDSDSIRASAASLTKYGVAVASPDYRKYPNASCPDF